MIYSATTEYAVRALAHLAAQPPGERMLARDLATATGVPRQFLGKILHKLARLGMLDSAKGRGGGFRFLREPELISLGEIVEAIEGRDILGACVLGLEPCNDQQICPVHDQWMPLRDRMRDNLHSSSMADLGRNLKLKLPREGATPVHAGTAPAAPAAPAAVPSPAPAHAASSTAKGGGASASASSAASPD
jgi:Rrf2 family protein